MKKYFSLAFLVVIAFTSCTKTDTTKPTACFSINDGTHEVGAVVTFTDCSEHASKLYLDFGDGSGEQSAAVVTHVYGGVGTYNVTLTAENGTDRNTVQHNIVITPNRSGAYSGDDTTFDYPVHNVLSTRISATVIMVISGTNVTLTSGNTSYNFTNGILRNDSVILDESMSGYRYEGAGTITESGGSKVLDINLKKWNSNNIIETYHFHGTK